MQKVICPYCGEVAEFCSSARVYYGKHYGDIYLCECLPEKAYVGVHKGTERPKGTLANKELRELRKKVHAVFDPIWKEKRKTRSKAYKWLANEMKINTKKCHIGMFNIEQCKQAIQICVGE
jgi:hypothetical protein